MIKFLNNVVRRFKGEEFYIDNSVPTIYLFRFFIIKFICFLYGKFIFLKRGMYFINPSSKILCKSKIEFGKGLSVDRNCYIDAMSKDGIILGRNVSIGKNTTIECTGSLKLIGKGLLVGDNVGLGTHGFYGCAGGIEIGDNTIFGNFVSLHSENHNYEDLNIPIRLQGVNRSGIKIGSNCWIGAKVTILDGVTISNNCIIAAGSLVTKGNYEEYCIYGGNPAKILRRLK